MLAITSMGLQHSMPRACQQDLTCCPVTGWLDLPQASALPPSMASSFCSLRDRLCLLPDAGLQLALNTTVTSPSSCQLLEAEACSRAASHHAQCNSQVRDSQQYSAALYQALHKLSRATGNRPEQTETVLTCSMESSTSSCVLKVGDVAKNPESLTSSTVSPMESTCNEKDSAMPVQHLCLRRAAASRSQAQSSRFVRSSQDALLQSGTGR